MLDLSKIEFTESPDKYRANTNFVRGAIIIWGGRLVDQSAAVPTEVVHAEIKEQIWNEAYGELHQPLWELQLYARRNAKPEDRQAINDLCIRINQLLTRREP